jgi:hypothetical protein
MSTYKINDCCNATTAELNHSCNCKTTMKFEDYIMDELRNGKSMDEIMKYISDRANAAESTFKAEQNKKAKSPWLVKPPIEGDRDFIFGNLHAKINDALVHFSNGNITPRDFIVLLIESIYQIAPAMRSQLDEIDLDDADIDILAEAMEKEFAKMNKLFSIVDKFSDDSDVDKITKFLESLV